MKKTIFTLIMCLSLAIVFASCGNTATESSDSEDSTSSTISASYDNLTFEIPENYVLYKSDGDARYRDADSGDGPVDAAHYEIMVYTKYMSDEASAQQAVESFKNQSDVQEITIDGYPGIKFTGVQEAKKYEKYGYSMCGVTNVGKEFVEFTAGYHSDSDSEEFDPSVEKAFDQLIKSVKIDTESSAEEPTEAKMTKKKLKSELKKQPCYVSDTEYYVQDENYKSIYPDLLIPKIKNQSGTDIKDVEVAFLAWDSDDLPMIIDCMTGHDGYLVYSDFDGINLNDGDTYSEMGLQLSENGVYNSPIDKFKAIVVSYTDFDGNKWENPLFNDWRELYEEKRLN